jgi:hypothetical protein
MDGLDVAFFFWRLGLRDSAVRCRGELLERLFRGRDVDLRPERMVVAHCLAPVGKRKGGIGLLRFLESLGCLVELEAV